MDPNLDPLRVKRKTLETVLLQCHRALQLINSNTNTAAGVEFEEDFEGEVQEATPPPDPDDNHNVI
ncbi:hypothetical protein SESBI_38341 [Sesbania bispinosa]|nr:hypothetical protein SESBI_38341 [Sesbania bispinosa]